MNFTGTLLDMVGRRNAMEAGLREQGWTEGTAYLNGAEHVVEWTHAETGVRLHIGYMGLDAHGKPMPWKRAPNVELRVTKLPPADRSTVSL